MIRDGIIELSIDSSIYQYVFGDYSYAFVAWLAHFFNIIHVAIKDMWLWLLPPFGSCE